jgi:molybdate transport system substrate-binding protein
MSLHVLSGGAAKGIVGALGARFRDEIGADINGDFSAVGAIEERFISGEACDVLILTAPLIAALAAAGRVRADTVRPIGAVCAGVAVPAGHTPPDIATAAAFAAALRAASAIHVPDCARSTAGRHFAGVLKKLGLEAEVAPKLREFPNGETAMAALARDRQIRAIGCTQVTEIKLTRGLDLIGPLPAGLDLATVYVAAVSAMAADPVRAGRLVGLLGEPRTRALRLDCGFEP